jgi:predicted dehydrogenase
MNPRGRTVALVGGGRWGRAHASNLSKLLTPRDRVVWVSRHNQVILPDVVSQFSNGPHFGLVTSLGDALLERPVAALVVTSPETHVAIADACLRGGIHTFVEKPLAFKAREARMLIDIAADGDLLLAAGLHLLSASYLRHFRNQLSSREISWISMRWFDPVHEERYGETKRANGASSIVHDLYPHLWSIVKVLTQCSQQQTKNLSKRADGSFLWEASAGSVDVEAYCGRFARERERRISVRLRDGGYASLDFTREPGEGMLDGLPLSADPAWGKTPRPIMAEVKEFLERISSPSRDGNWPHLAANCIDSVIGAEVLHSRLKR